MPGTCKHVPLNEDASTTILAQKSKQVAGAHEAVVIAIQHLENQKVDFPQSGSIDDCFHVGYKLPVVELGRQVKERHEAVQEVYVQPVRLEEMLELLLGNLSFDEYAPLREVYQPPEEVLELPGVGDIELW